MKRSLLALLIALFIGLTAQIAGAADPVLLVVNKHEDTMSYVNPDTLESIAKVTTGHDPHEIVITPDRRYAYLSNYAPPGDTISVVDLVDRQHVQTIPTGSYTRVHGAAIAPDGEHAYFTAGQTGFVVEVDTEANRVTRAIRTHGKISHMVLVSPDGKYLYTANITSENVSIIEIESSELVAQVPCGEGCEGMAFTPDGKRLWAANQNAGTITVIDTATHRAVETFECPGTPLRIAFTKDGERALVTSWEAEGELLVLDVARREIIKRIPVGNQPIGVLMTPDEKRAFVSNMTSDDLHAIDLEEFEVTERFVTGKGPDALAWWTPPEPGE